MRRKAIVFAVAVVAVASIGIAIRARRPSLTPLPAAPVSSTPAGDAPWVEWVTPLKGCPSAVCQPLVWLTVHHNDDGTWGDGSVGRDGPRIGKVGLTSLALLALLGGGYDPYSKDIFEFEGGEWRTGAEIQKALVWLQQDQNPDGTYRSSALAATDQALAALALSDLYGLTLRQEWKKPAQLALGALETMQHSDGSWGDASATAWALIALCSAKVSELEVAPESLDRALGCSIHSGHPVDALARILSHRDEMAAVGLLKQEAQKHDPSDLEWWYLSSLVMWANHGTPGSHWCSYKPGPEWDPWRSATIQKIRPLFSKDVSVEGKSLSDTIARTSLAQLVLEVDFEFSATFRPH